MSHTTKQIAKPYAYSADEVIAFRDDDHTPYNKRAGECDSTIELQVRSPINAEWINIHLEERTVTKSKEYSSEPYRSRTATRVLSINLSREQFAAIAAHVVRKDSK